MIAFWLRQRKGQMSDKSSQSYGSRNNSRNIGENTIKLIGESESMTMQ